MPVAQRKALVPRDTEGRQQVEPLVQERLEAGGRRVGGMKQVVNLLAGRAQSGHWRGGRRDLKKGKRLADGWNESSAFIYARFQVSSALHLQLRRAMMSQCADTCTSGEPGEKQDVQLLSTLCFKD